jgi:hypothetical protein
VIESNAKVALNAANKLSQCCILQMNVKIVYKLILSHLNLRTKALNWIENNN